MTPLQILEQAKTPDCLPGLALQALDEQLHRLRTDHFRLAVLTTEHPFQRADRRHFHGRPELLLQLAGVSIMNLRDHECRYDPGTVVLTSRGVEHLERADRNALPFCNLIFMFEEKGFFYHSAVSEAGDEYPGQIRIRQRRYVEERSGGRLYGYLNEISSLSGKGYAAGHAACTGLMMTHLAMLREALSGEKDRRPLFSPLVSQCHQLVFSHLSDPRLSVRWLASEIRCSADYLSHLFHTETGRPLNARIRDERLRLACHLLVNTRLNCAETARSCGYRDPSYFTRLFTRQLGQTPSVYRRTHAD